MSFILNGWISRLKLTICGLFLVTACAPSQQEMMAKAQLERARSACLQAKSNPNVEAFASLPMADASKAVQIAEKTKGPEGLLHLAYIAEKKCQMAVAVAESRMGEKEIDRLGKESTDLIAQKRTEEARIAQKQAAEARAAAAAEIKEAERARKEAEAARRSADEAKRLAAAEADRAAKAKAEAEARAREAEQARIAALAEAEKAARAKAESDQLMRELSELKAQQTERGIVLTIGDVLFATGKSDLSPNALRSVEKLAEFLDKHANRNVLIEGHTDSVGSDEFNLRLSEERAASVKGALASRGISEERISTKGYGKKYPLASNDTPAGKQQNRRVEVIILNEGVKPESQFRE